MTQELELIDFIIITPLEDERDAVLEQLGSYELLKPDTEDNRVYYRSRLAVDFPDESKDFYNIVVVPLLAMGTGQAAATTADAIRRWSPRNVLVVGIAGGVKAVGVSLGDLLIASLIADYSVQKHQSGKDIEIRWDVHQVDTALLERAKNFASTDWFKAIRAPRPVAGQPRRHVGPIASGDHVVASATLLDTYRGPWAKLIGVEMEGAGVARVAFQSKGKAGFFMVRATSDLADEAKDSPQAKAWR
jgi:nucleoside phosphorylase